MSKSLLGVLSLGLAFGGCAHAPAQKAPVALAVADEKQTLRSVGDNQIIGLDLMSLHDGHGGPQYFPLQGDPIVGQEHLVDLQIYKAASQVTLELRNPQGKLLKSLPMERTRSAEQADSDMHWGVMLAFPAEPIELVVAGTAPDGKPFRLPTRRYEAKTLELNLAYFPSIIGGRPYEYEVELRNYGPADHFELTIEDDAHFLPAPVKQHIELKTAESTTIRVNLTLPVQGDGESIEDHLYATVISASQPANRVDASAELSLLPGRDGDADMIGDDMDNCPSLSNAQQLDEDEDGMGDDCDPMPQQAAKKSKKKG